MNLRDFAEILVERVNKGWDSVVIVDSGSVKGTGKTTFSLHMCKEVCELIGEEFSLKRCVIFDPTNEKIVESVKRFPLAFPLDIDEAGKVAYKRNWNKEYQKKLIIFISVCRKHGKIIFFNHPSFWQLDTDLRDLADYRVTILKRGIALVRAKDPNPEAKDKWLRDETEELIQKYRGKNILEIDRIIEAIKQAPNFLFEIRFPEFDQNIYKKYEEMSKEEELKSFYEASVDKYREFLFPLAQICGLIKEKIDGQRLSWNVIARAINHSLRAKGLNLYLDVSFLREMAIRNRSFVSDEEILKILGLQQQGGK